jgi:uncharacterized membrane protein
MKNYTNGDICRLVGLLAMVASVVLGVVFSVLFTGFGLLFFGVTFVIGLVIFVIGLAFRRSSARTATST